MSQLPHLPYTLQNIRDLQFNSIFNLRPLGSYSLREFGSGDTKHRIYQNYIHAYESDFTSRAGIAPDEFAEKAGLHQKLLSTNEEFINNFKISQHNFSINNTQLNKYIKDLISGDDERINKLQGKEHEILKALELWHQATSNYLKTLTSVNDLYYFRNMNQSKVKSTISMASGRSISEAFRLERGTLTAVQNADAMLTGLEQALTQLDKAGATAKTLSELIITTPSYEGINGTVASASHKIGDLRKMVGSLSNILGFAFEVQLASGLTNQISQALSDVALLGGAEGVSIKLSDGRPFNVKQSKTDLRSTINGVDVGFSLKNVSKKGKTSKRISLNTSNVNQLITLLSNDQGYRSQLAGTLMWRANSIKKTRDQLTMFLAALAADYAVAMGGNDRIDYMVFNDRVISLGEYYSIMEKKLLLKITPSSSQAAYQKQLRELREREILANMPIKFTS